MSNKLDVVVCPVVETVVGVSSDKLALYGQTFSANFHHEFLVAFLITCTSFLNRSSCEFVKVHAPCKGQLRDGWLSERVSSKYPSFTFLSFISIVLHSPLMASLFLSPLPTYTNRPLTLGHPLRNLVGGCVESFDSFYSWGFPSLPFPL